jgi:O-antigen ligase
VRIREYSISTTSPARLQTGEVVSACVAVCVIAGTEVAESASLSSLPLRALLGLAAAVIALSVNPEILFTVWLMAAPFLQESAHNTRYGHLAAQALYLLPPLLLALAFALRRDASRRFWLIDALPALYIIYIFISMALVSSEPTSVTGELRPVYVTAAIGICLYYFIAFGPTTPAIAVRVAAAVLGSGCVMAVMTIVEGFTSWNLWNDTVFWDSVVRRAVATLGNPAVLGTFLGAGVAIALAVLLWDGPDRLKRRSKVFLVLALPALYFTYTRGPLIATAAVGVLMVLVATRARWPSVLLLVVVGVLLFVTWGRISSTSVYENRLSNSETAQTRLVLQDWSLQLAQERPILGWGYLSFDRVKNTSDIQAASASQVAGVSTRVVGVSNTSHNTFLTVLVELGAVGVALLVVPWLVIGWRALQAAREHAQGRWAFVAAVAVLGIYAVSAGTLDMRFFSFVPALAWVMAGVARRLLAERERQSALR